VSRAFIGYSLGDWKQGVRSGDRRYYGCHPHGLVHRRLCRQRFCDLVVPRSRVRKSNVRSCNFSHQPVLTLTELSVNVTVSCVSDYLEIYLFVSSQYN